MRGLKRIPPEAVSDVRYAHPGHVIFNEALEAQRNPPPKSADLSAPWMKPEVLARLPQVHRDFDVSRDPIAQVQIEARERKSAHQRESGSSSKEQDLPKPALRPKGDLRKRGDQAAREESWMARQRDAAMNAAAPLPKPQENTHEYERMPPALEV